jgi:hypothetical protein
MYHQINPTEMLRERQLALLKEAENGRLARRLRAGRAPKAKSRKAAVLGILAALVVAGFMLVASSSPAHASTTFTVNSTGDENDIGLDGVCDVSSASGNQCTLRSALQEANHNQNAPAVDTINFNIVSLASVQTIKPGGDLSIGDPVIIDGYSQPATRPNTLQQGDNAVIKIELDGSEAGVGATGLEINRGSGSVIKGLAINNYSNYGIAIFSAGGNKIEGNFIGTDPSATIAKPNTNGGVFIGLGAFGESNASFNTVGGNTPAARNVVSGNFGEGVYIEDDSNKVIGNYIGTDRNATGALGNGFYGVRTALGASHNTIGGTSPEEANTIAFNSPSGVAVSDNGIGNSVLSNSIFSNVGLGIDLNQDGVSANDPGDVDAGSNGLQNKPVITSATTGSSTIIKGRLNSVPNKSFTVQVFASPQLSSSGNGQGKTFLGEKAVSTDGSGKVTFTFKASQKVPRGQFIIATATDSVNNTSEFSAAKKVVRRR